MLDPGVGFGKTYENNLEAINRLDALKKFNLPILLGTSRKSVIALTLDLPKDQRVEGTLATTVIEAINRLDALKKFNLPILLGTSRKSVIALTLDLPKDQRVEGTLATTVIGMMRGAAFVRVHDVKENARVIRMTEAILGR